MEIKDIELVKDTLPIGDVYFPEKGVVIERKTIEDFWQSLISGHLHDQAANMLASDFKGKFIIIEGKYSEFYKNVFARGGFVNIKALNNFKVSLTCKYGINIIEVQDTNQFASTCISIAEMFGETPDLIRMKKLDFSDDDRAVAMLTAVDGISKTLARRLLEKFGSIEALMSVTPEQVQELDGFGAKKSKLFVERFRSIIKTNVKPK